MATNPMQRKARMYGLVGALITLLITGVIIIFLIMQLQKTTSEKETYREVYALIQDVKSGETISEDKLQAVIVPMSAYPENSFHNDDIDKGIIANPISTTAIAKVDLKAGTIITDTMVTEPEDTLTKDVRKVEYNNIVLPSQLETGDYIDIRLQLPYGDNYIVVSKKEVLQTNEDTVWLNMSEFEILMMSSATVENYMMTGSKLYAVIYTEAGTQEQAINTYYPSSDVAAVMKENPNIVEEAKNWANSNLRESTYQKSINHYLEKGLENIEAGISEEITKSVEARQEFVESMGVSDIPIE